MSTSCFDTLIRAAKAGDDAAARILLGNLAEYLERGIVPPAALAGYFVPAFKQIVDGRRKAEEALHTKGKSVTVQRNYDIARAVWWINNRPIDPLPLSLEPSAKHPIGAYDAVAEMYGLKPESVKKIYSIMNKQFDLESSEPPMTQEESRQLEVDTQLRLAKLAEILKNKGKD